MRDAPLKGFARVCCVAAATVAVGGCDSPTTHDTGGLAIDVVVSPATGLRAGDTVTVRFRNTGTVAAYTRPWCYTTEKLGSNGWARDTALTVGCASLPQPEMVPIGGALEHQILWHPAAKRPDARIGTFRVAFLFQTDAYAGGHVLTVTTPIFRIH